MNEKTASTRTFVALIVLYAVLAGLNFYLPQGPSAPAQPTVSPIPVPVLALANAGIVLVFYGAFGLLGLFCSRKLGLPKIWDTSVTNPQRFLIPGLIGVAAGILIIVLDILFSPINGIGHIPHPPFPTSVVASVGAAIGEETLFRLFFISFWTWLISRVILRSRWQTPIYWVVSAISSIAFAMSHLPGMMFLEKWTSMGQVPPVLIVELLLLNGAIGMAAAWLFRKYGFLAPVGLHLWADFVWHVIWGLI